VRRSKRWSPDAVELELLTEQLFYEVQMTFFLAGQLDTPTGSRLDVSLRNAQIEACAAHLRQLVYFFWGERPRSADEPVAFAADYFEEGEWAQLRPALPAILDKALRDRVGFRKLAYDRTWAPPADQLWDVVSQAFALVAVIVRFAEVVDHGKLAPGYVNGMKICAEVFTGAKHAAA
jgi:hypothetical protein